MTRKKYGKVTYDTNHPRNQHLEVAKDYPERPAHGVISDIMVCQSNAGYYIGTLIYDFAMNYWLPHDRDSVEYYPDERTATQALENEEYTLRDYI
jgi:hypothetical protein|tara:strand:+ start:643 stop:927 length:285 start_codon:yes stop_codon:yes gene_type:complete